MPSASLQSRIRAFEALSSSSSSPTPDTRTSPSSLLESPISPAASTFHPIIPLAAPSATRSRSPSPSTPSLAHQTSLIDLRDWVVEDGPVDPPPASAAVVGLNGVREPTTTPSPSSRPTPGGATTLMPLISFEPPQKSRPPLPPRNPSSNAVDRVSAQRTAGGAAAVLRPPARSDSLTVEHTYPPSAHKFGVGRVGHAPASSISSFKSVSLSSDGSNADAQGPKLSPNPPLNTLEADGSAADLDTASIAESFENVSAPSAASPLTTNPFDWEPAIGKPKSSPRIESGLSGRSGAKFVPVVPPKPLARSVSASSSTTAASTKTRRPPPPPPYQPRSRPSSSRASVVSTSASTSDRSSVRSSATATSRTSISTRGSAQPVPTVKSPPLLRPTPLPPAARARYESLFDSAVHGRRKAERQRDKVKLLAPPLPARKSSQAAGWRRLSVDLTTSDHPVPSSEKGCDESDIEEEELSPISSEERLNGRVVRYIWSTSRLDRKKLSSIWNDCDPECTGFVDRDAFVRGMWRIDEELRRAQLARRTSALAAASSQRIPHRPLPPPRQHVAATLLT